MIAIDGISKRYFNIKALENVSFEVQTGAVLGLLGPNGAGKSTLFRILAGLLNPDRGQIRLAGGMWPRIGFKPEALLFPNHLTVNGYMRTTAALDNLPAPVIGGAVNQTLARVGLAEVQGKRIRDCSNGMRQRLALAQTLLGDATLFLWDEPWNGLDPEGQATLKGLISGLHQRGKTVVISSHRLHDITEVCTDLIILHRGRVVYENSMAGALAERPQATIQVDRDPGPLAPLLKALHPDIELESRAVNLLHDAVGQRRRVLSLLLSAGYDVLQVEQRQMTLHDIYAEIVQ